MNWFRMYGEFATDPKVQMLSEADQRRLCLLFCIRCSNGDVTLQDDEVTFLLRISPEEWGRSKSLFVDRGFIDSDNKVLNWDKRQCRSDSSAERVAAFRERMKQDGVTGCNVTVTPQNRTEQSREERASNLPDGKLLVAASGNVPAEIGHDGSNGPEIAERTRCPTAEIVALYHAELPELPRVEKVTKAREGYIRQRWTQDLKSIDEWRNYFAFVRKSKFLMGRSQAVNGRPPFRADLEWITRPGNFAKIAEEKYHHA